MSHPSFLHLSIFGAILACAMVALPLHAQDANAAPALAAHAATLDLRPALDDGLPGPSLVSTTTPAANETVAAPAIDPNSAGPLPGSTSPLNVAAYDVPPMAPGSAPTMNIASNDVPPTASGADPAAAPDSSPAAATPSENVTINLINLMVKRKLLTQDDADSLIRQATQEADLARAQAASTQAAAERALAAASTPPAPAPSSSESPDQDEVRVPYIPDVVKNQITDQVTQNVMEQTREEHLADTIAANSVPEWVKRFNVEGDIRLRYEGDFYPSGSALGNFTNFNAINTGGAGFNINSAAPALPQYDVNQERDRFRLRARIGAGIDLGEGFTAGMRVATGSDNSPVTENQTFGLANNGQGGNFSKYNIWLDRAYLRYVYGSPDDLDVAVTLGRFDNPFFNTSMMWANDLGFDGAVVKAQYKVTHAFTPFLTAGGFPVFNTDFNFSSDQSSKFKSEDKYLFAAQGGTHWTINKDFSAIGAVGIYDFENIQGRVSSPIFNAGLNAGNTDDSRPAFAQNGNTYIALRDYEDPTAVPGVTVENQYYGLATPFRVLALTGQLDYDHFDPFHMSITGEVINNLAFDRNTIIHNGPASDPGPQNNTTNASANSFDGGDTGYLIHLDLGKVTLDRLGDWNVRLSYRYVETDATVDGFTDSDFGADLSGTNLKGYDIGGNFALSHRVWAQLRYMSADSVSGPTYKNDLIQFDINAKF